MMGLDPSARIQMIHPPEGRVELDYYPTPAWMVHHLIDDFESFGYREKALRLLDPCVGSGRIVKAFEERWPSSVWQTNDLDPRWPADSHMDAGDRYFSLFGAPPRDVPPDWIITNPPFNEAHRIIPRAHETAVWGLAMLLRISWLEPCEDRATFLETYPPDRMIVMPRWSFRRNGKTDSAITVWLIWSPVVPKGFAIKRHKGKQEAFDLG